ncbi:MAG: galactose-1-phosphate uridylyltransferase, partial [Pirellulaceae bacterium]
QATSGPGHQEVIVLSPRHVVSLSGLSDEELITGFRVFQQRLQFHQHSASSRHVCIFMNCRPPAGASIEHAHVQLIASPVCTDQVHERVRRMITPTTADQTLWQDLLDRELADQTRIVEVSDGYLVFCPFASRYSNQIRIAPRFEGSFAELPNARRDELAGLCRKWIDGIERCLDDIAWNLIFQLPPSDMPDAPWFVDLVPRFPQSAGFELATDCWVNPVSPETAADQFRKFEQGQSGI